MGIINTFLEIYTLPNVSDGLDESLVVISSQVETFIPMFLFFIFCVITIGGAINQKRRTGSADLPMWATMGSISTLLVSLTLTLTAGIIQSETLIVVVTITMFSGLWLFLDRNRNEV